MLFVLGSTDIIKVKYAKLERVECEHFDSSSVLNLDRNRKVVVGIEEIDPSVLLDRIAKAVGGDNPYLAFPMRECDKLTREHAVEGIYGSCARVLSSGNEHCDA